MIFGALITHTKKTLLLENINHKGLILGSAFDIYEVILIFTIYDCRSFFKKVNYSKPKKFSLTVPYSSVYIQ